MKNHPRLITLNMFYKKYFIPLNQLNYLKRVFNTFLLKLQTDIFIIISIFKNDKDFQKASLIIINAINNPKYRFGCAAISRRQGKTYISILIGQLDY